MKNLSVVVTTLFFLPSLLIPAGPQIKYVFGVPVEEIMNPVRNEFRAPGDTIYSFPCPEDWPIGLSADGIYFWHNDVSVHMIYKLDSTGQILKSFPMPQNAWGGDVELVNGNLWMLDEELAVIFELDTATGQVIKQVPAPDSGASDPNCLGLTWDGACLWVSKYASDARIFKIDTITGAIISSFAPPSMFIGGICWHDGHIFGIDIFNMTLYKMNPQDSSVVDSMPWLLPYALGLIYDDGYFWNVSSDADNGGMERIYKVESREDVAEDPDKKPGQRQHWEINATPNPFATTGIRYACAADCYLELKIYDLQGKLVKTLVQNEVPAGIHNVKWNGSDEKNNTVQPGIYFVHLRTSQGIGLMRKLIFIR